MIMLSVIGYCSSKRLWTHSHDEVRASRHSVSPGLLLMVVYLKVTVLMFAIFLFATLWFTFFNQYPATWMESTYFQKQYFVNSDKPNQPDQAEYKALSLDAIQDNIKLFLVVLGLFCGLITYVLYISMQLMKKLLRRMERVHTLIQLQSTALAVLTVGLIVLLQTQINFDSTNASSVILEDMPWEYQNQYFFTGCFLLFIAVFTFIASYQEVNGMFNLSTLLCSVAIFALLVLSVTNEITSSTIVDKLDDKCAFVLPQFSQDMLMENGCQMKYLSYAEKFEELTCPKLEVSRIWEDNLNLLVEDQKDVYGCVN